MYLSPLAQNLTPYTAGEQPKDQRYIKLNTNENPYPPSPRALAAIMDAAQNLRLYPDMNSTALSKAIAKVNGVQEENVFCANGSDEALALAFAAFFAGKKLISPDITYSFYPTYSKLFGVDYQTIPLKSDFSVDTAAMHKGAAIALANPNAPTGKLLETAEVEALLKHTWEHGQIMLVDEAYAAFAQSNALPLLPLYDNLLIVRTFSKSHGLAGMRVGYAIGSKELIGALNRVKDSFNSYPLDWLAQAAAREAVLDEEYTLETTKKIIAAREHFSEGCKKLGLDIVPSSTNFVFVKADEENAAWVKDGLKSRGILVRHFSAPRIAPYLRVSIGTLADMEKTLDVLSLVLKEGR